MHKVKLIIFWLIILGLAIWAIVFFWNAQKYQPVSYADCIVHNGIILETYPEQCSFHGKTFSNPDQHAETPPSQQNELKTYTDSKNGFSLEYPSNIFTKSSEKILLPFADSDASAEAVSFSHSVDLQHCGLSGLPEHCTPTTTDIKMNVAVVPLSIPEIEKSKIGSLQAFTAGPPGTMYTEQGVEGEGIIYYFIPFSQDSTIMVTRSYINENVVGGYKGVSDFIPYAKQTSIATDIISSITFK